MKTHDFDVREAVPDDAPALIDHVHRLCDEPGVCITLDRDEFTFTIDQERQFVSEVNASDNSVFLVAEAAGGGVIGLLVAHGGKRRATRHASVIAISVTAGWRGRGVGTALMARCVDWARSTGVVTRLELKVFTRNAPAIALYERFGFVTEGVCRRSVFRGGQYEDNRLMALLL